MLEKLSIPLLLGLTLLPSAGRGADALYQEPFRPRFHFSPPRNWMNDPNGLVFHDGTYHLFYQYNPQGDKWGHMSWGHAASKDLFHWENLPLALPEKDGVMIFSGSAVVDAKNTSGFGQGGKPPLVAIYTGAREKHQDQRIAYSNDEGKTWTQYAGNPVLDLGLADFRDPKVFWHEPSGKWVLVTVLAVEKKVRLFSSPDLKNWTALSDFGPAGSTAGVWECPDLFPLPVEGETRQKWVLLVSLNPGGPAGGSGTQYFVGDFDGTRFNADPVPADKPKADAPAATPATAAGKVFADFEGQDYAGWTVAGAAFGTGPSHNTSGDLSGYVGKGYVDSFGSSDADTGKLTSPSFKIEAPAIHFLLGGGSHPDQAGMNLIIDGKTVRTSTGNNSPRLEPQSWDVSEFVGRTATLEIFDNYGKDDWGHIFVDQIVFGGAAPAKTVDPSALWLDYGSDNYAAVTWSDVPSADGRRILLGWMNNWTYGQDVPTAPWRSAMTVPRMLSLRKTGGGLRLLQRPVTEMQALRNGKPRKFAGGSFTDAASWLAGQKDLSAALDVELSFSNVSEQTPFTLNVRSGPGEVIAITCDTAKGEISVDRTRSGRTDFHRAFAAKHSAPLRVPPDGRLSLRLVLDTSSLELFAQDGETVITDCFFAKGSARQFELTATMADTPAVNTMTISTLNGSMSGGVSSTQ